MQRFRDALGRLDLWLGEHRSTRILRGSVTGFMAHEVLQYAGAMAYFAVLSIVNLFVLGVVAASFVVGEGAGRQLILDRAAEALPLGRDQLAELLDRAIAARGSVTAIGLVLLTWSALGVFGALSGGISRVFTGTPHRPFWKERVIGLVLLAGTAILGIASLVLGLLVELLGNSVESRISLPGVGSALAIVAFVVPMVLVFLAFFFVYRIVPTRPLPVGDAAAGAVVAAVLWTALRIGFVLYATRVAKYDTIFGPLGTAISLLVFLYFSSVILLLGAEVARASAQELDPERRPAPQPVSDPVDASPEGPE
jgi:membrane protein